MYPNRTKAELIKELQELRQENNFLKELYNKVNTTGNYPDNTVRETDHKLTLAMQGGKMAWWEMDVTTGNVTFDKHKVEMLGYPIENFKHFKDFTALVHPQDYDRIMSAMRGHLDGVFDKYEAEYRILSKSGEYIWFYDYGSVVKKDSNGAPLICTGFVYNISERKNAEKSMLKRLYGKASKCFILSWIISLELFFGKTESRIIWDVTGLLQPEQD
jgi:PAS domain S-box-containing protein